MNKTTKVKDYNTLDMKGKFYIFTVHEIKLNKEINKKEIIEYLDEKLERYKRKPQIINKENEIIIINLKKYLFYFQLKIGKRIMN